MNLRPGRLGVASRYQCVFGRDLWKPKQRVLTSPVISAAQEVFRCVTPARVRRHLRMTTDPNGNGNGNDKPMLVSIRTKGQRDSTLPSIAEPEPLPPRHNYRHHRRRPKAHSMCVCTMLRNQARFLREWIIYHSRIGVERWFIYDNNSDEFLHFPGNQTTLPDILRSYSNRPRVGELRTACHSFGPSGRTRIPKQGVTTGYTCRLAAPERHKSIVRPDALNPSLVNVVHHFHLREGARYVNVGQGAMLVNHYKYQVWEVFKDKFSGRVATYVADWRDEENVGSRDRAPGLGTRPVEPEDWPRRFCEVYDTGLKDFVQKAFADPATGSLPW
ncbi:zinc finger (C3HC4-type RING finger) family protein [Zea mays]|uniref:Glycosyltransferase family 92 protein n=1 Tax=Zea mays TaxID=4577 RepID=A0A1D6PWT2_MAIZE|nr:zinc finger (C3HC4-type RING finger) family protein [Zea mays]